MIIRQNASMTTSYSGVRKGIPDFLLVLYGNLSFATIVYEIMAYPFLLEIKLSLNNSEHFMTNSERATAM